MQSLKSPSPAVTTTRIPTTMWALLVWAYRRQMVQYETDKMFEYRPIGSFAETLGGGGAGYAAERGCINGAGTSADPQAHILHAHIMTLPARQRDLLIDAAAAGQMPLWNPAIPEHRVIPSRKGGTGTIRMIWSKKRQPIGCLIEYEGIPWEEAEAIRRAARERYVLWWNAMRAVKCRLLFERGLTKWKVVGIGAPREPWDAPT